MERFFAALVLALGLSNAAAGPIVYEIVPRFPQGPIVLTGTLTTDGTIGVLAASNIVAWAFDLTDIVRSGTVSISSTTGRTDVSGTALVATDTDLTFNFNNPFFQFRVGFTAPPIPNGVTAGWFLGTRALFNGTGVESIQSTTNSDFAFRFNPDVIGIARPTVVPEPPVSSLIGAGLVVAVFARRLRASGRRLAQRPV